MPAGRKILTETGVLIVNVVLTLFVVGVIAATLDGFFG